MMDDDLSKSEASIAFFERQLSNRKDGNKPWSLTIILATSMLILARALIANTKELRKYNVQNR